MSASLCESSLGAHVIRCIFHAVNQMYISDASPCPDLSSACDVHTCNQKLSTYLYTDNGRTCPGCVACLPGTVLPLVFWPLGTCKIFFSCSTQLSMTFGLIVNLKVLTTEIVSYLTELSMKFGIFIFICREKSFITLGPGQPISNKCFFSCIFTCFGMSGLLYSFSTVIGANKTA